MKITVAGQDRTGDLGPAMAAEADRLRAGGGIGALAPDHTALRLKRSRDLDDYVYHFVELLRMRHGVRTSDYYIPRGPGLRGTVAVAVKTFLWKLLRYQHDRLTLQQNLINELEINAVEFQRDRVNQELADLKRRVADLEQACAKGAP